MTWRKALATSTLRVHRHAVLVYQGEQDVPTFVVPFVLRRRAEQQAAVARSRKGLGFAIGELRVPFYLGPVRADVVRLDDPCPADVVARLAAA